MGMSSVSNIQHLNQRVLSYTLTDSCSCSSTNDPIRHYNPAGLIVVFLPLHVHMMKKCKQTATTAQAWTLQAAVKTVITLLLKNSPKEGV